MRKISVYVKGDRNSTAYYRIYQYFDKIKTIDVKYNVMYPQWVQDKLMPVSRQPKLIQVVIYFAAFFKILSSLLKDLLNKPDVIVIHKRVLSRYMPSILKVVLKKCHKNGTKIIWDYDDHVVKGNEMSQKTFDFFADIADIIVVTHEYLQSLLPEYCLCKSFILPTTDGDMFLTYKNNNLESERMTNIQNEIDIVWVATSNNIKNLAIVLSFLDKAAEKLNQIGRELVLKVVCDKPLEYVSQKLKIENIKWTRKAAIDCMRLSHIGIMPLRDVEYNKGKGGFKLIQYLSIGLPCIGSKVGFNNQVISNDCGFLVENTENEWVEAILNLSKENNWKEYSKNAYIHWEKYFSYSKNLEFWENILKK